MAKNKKYLVRTYPIKSLTIFLAICFVTSVAMLITFSILRNEPWVIRILVWICCGIFTAASGFMLVVQLGFHVSIDDEAFYRHVPFGKYKIPFNKIERVVNADGFYTIYVRGKKTCSFATNTKESAEIIVILEKKGVKIDW